MDRLTIRTPTKSKRRRYSSLWMIKKRYDPGAMRYVLPLPTYLHTLQYNLVGRLLGPKGLTLKRIQAETQTKMSILGRGSMRDKGKEEELRNGSDPAYLHLKENLHIVIEATGPHSVAKLAAGVAEVRKMLIPPVSFSPTVPNVVFIFVVFIYSGAGSTRSNWCQIPGIWYGRL